MTTITIHLSPETEEVLRVRARERGMSVDAYAQSIIDSEATMPASKPGMLAMSAEEFEAALDELSADSDRLPVLPPEATSREGIYEER